MAVPLATTTITVHGVRPQSAVDPDAEGYDAPPPAPTMQATGIRATISLPQSARGSSAAVSSPADEVDTYTLSCDPVELTRHDTVTDDTTGVVYEVETVIPSPTVVFGLQHIKAKLKRTEGLTNGPA